MMNAEKFMSGDINMEDTTEQIWNKVKTDTSQLKPYLGISLGNTIGSALMKTAGTQYKRKIKPIESS
jgi:hypothetical protein